MTETKTSLRKIAGRLVLLAVTVAMAGCSLIPTTGPVQSVPQPPLSTGAPPVDIEPAPPVPGANPDSILAGFLAAVASGSPSRFAIARQYLTTRAAAAWDPTQGVTIYSSDGSPIVTEKTAVLKTPVIGKVDADGHYTSVNQQDYSHNFNMVQDSENQWRIDDPGTGIYVSQYRFQTYFRAVPVYFFNRSLDQLVTENLYMNWADATPTSAIEGLLRGPSVWLSPAVQTVIPAQTKLWVSSVPVDSGVAQVSLTRQAAGLSDVQQVQMAAQLLSTLEGVSTAITGVRIDVEGTPLTVRGQDDNGVVRASAVSAFTKVVTPSSQDAYGIQSDGTVVRLPSSTGDKPQPVPGPLGVADSNWGDVAQSLAVSPDGSTLAIATESGLWVASATIGQTPIKRIDATGLVRPQIDAYGVWDIANGDVPTLWLVDEGGAQSHTELSELEGATVVSFRVSPDRTRIAVIARIDDTDVLGLLRLTSGAPLAADGWRSLDVDAGRGPVATCFDVGWASAGQMVVLAAPTKDASGVVYRLDVDAALVEALGPIGDDAPVGLAVQPRNEGTAVLVVTAGGAVLRYEDRTRWTGLGSGVTAVALAG